VISSYIAAWNASSRFASSCVAATEYISKSCAYAESQIVNQRPNEVEFGLAST